MVVKPSIDRFHFLMKSTDSAEGTMFVDQDMLNHVYKNKWKKLDSKYNIMHVDGPISSSAVAIHEKLWIMQEKYPAGQWIWNRQEHRVDSIIPNQLLSKRPQIKPRRRKHH